MKKKLTLGASFRIRSKKCEREKKDTSGSQDGLDTNITYNHLNLFLEIPPKCSKYLEKFAKLENVLNVSCYFSYITITTQ